MTIRSKRSKPVGLNEVMMFGKHQGRSVKEIIIIEVGWLLWLRKAKLSHEGYLYFDKEVNKILDKAISDDERHFRKFLIDYNKIKSEDMVAPIPGVTTEIDREEIYSDSWGEF